MSNVTTISGLSNQLSEVNQLFDKDVKIYVSSIDYDTLSALYNRDKNKYESGLNEELTGDGPMDIWMNSLGKTLMVCAYGKVEEYDDNSGTYMADTGKYELVAFAPDGRPIKIGPSFSEIDTNTYLRTGSGVDKKGNSFTYLGIDLINLSYWLTKSKDSEVQSAYSYLWTSYNNLYTYVTTTLEERLQKIENMLNDDVVKRSKVGDVYKAPTYLWSGSIDEYRAINNINNDDTTYIITR